MGRLLSKNRPEQSRERVSTSCSNLATVCSLCRVQEMDLSEARDGGGCKVQTRQDEDDEDNDGRKKVSHLGRLEEGLRSPFWPQSRGAGPGEEWAAGGGEGRPTECCGRLTEVERDRGWKKGVDEAWNLGIGRASGWCASSTTRERQKVLQKRKSDETNGRKTAQSCARRCMQHRLAINVGSRGEDGGFGGRNGGGERGRTMSRE